MQLGSYQFSEVCRIEPKRDPGGAIELFLPQARYRNERNLPLHKYGQGPFCKFTIPSKLQSSGVYALATSEKVKYVGKCINLTARYNSGYGQISPRNCFVGGQETNCRINALVLAETQMGRILTLCFHKTSSQDAIESELLALITPEWNRLGKGSSGVSGEVH
jgi:hypothetical protein